MKKSTAKPLMKEELEAALQNDPEGDELLEIWNMIPQEPALSAEELRADKEKFRLKVGQPAPIKRLTGLKTGLTLLAAAAAVLVFMIFQQRETSPVLVGDVESGKSFSLPDGSTVTLSQGSTLSLKNGMKKERTVVLNGEALFDVVSENRTFTVETSNAVVTVLGTIFKVTNGSVVQSDSLDYTKIMLAEGKVTVNYPALAVSEELLPGEETALIGKKHSKRTIQNNWLDNWKNGRIHFENESLTYIFSEIQRQYHIEVEIDATVNLEERLSFYRRRPAQPDSILYEIAAIKNLVISNKSNTFSVTRKPG